MKSLYQFAVILFPKFIRWLRAQLKPLPPVRSGPVFVFVIIDSKSCDK